MKLNFIPLLVCLSGITLISCNDKSSHSSILAKAPVVEDTTEVRGLWNSDTEYENPYFGLTLTLPKDWILKKGQDIEAMKRGADLIAGSDKKFKAEVEQAIKHTYMVFGVSKYPLGSPGQLNPNMNMMLENVSHIPSVKNERDYLKIMLDSLRRSPQKFEQDGAIQKETVNGIDFVTMQLTMILNGIKVGQKYYLWKKGDYILLNCLTHFDESSRLELDEMMKGFKLK